MIALSLDSTGFISLIAASTPPRVGRNALGFEVSQVNYAHVLSPSSHEQRDSNGDKCASNLRLDNTRFMFNLPRNNRGREKSV